MAVSVGVRAQTAPWSPNNESWRPDLGQHLDNRWSPFAGGISPPAAEAQQHGGHITDSDIVPLPLRIVKRQSATVSRSTLLRSQTQRALVPRRRSSSATDTTAQRDLSKHLSEAQDITRRQFDHSSNITKRPDGGHRHAIKDNGLVSKSASRAKSSSYPASMIIDRDAALRVPLTAVGNSVGPRRIVTAVEGFRRPARARQGESDAGLQKQPSSKESYLRRVISGRLNAMSHALYAPHVPERHALEAPVKPVEVIRESCSTDPILKPSIQGRTEVDTALAQFPRPPRSSHKLPTAADNTDPLNGHDSIPEQLSTFATGMQTGVELTLVSDQAYDLSAQRMMVAIEIGFASKAGHNENDDPLDHAHGIDVLVVIDNSIAVSPLTLMGSCEVTRILASTLDAATDRIGVLTTIPADSEQPGQPSNRVLALTAIKTKRVKLALDNISTTTTHSSIEAISTALEQAKRAISCSKTSPQNHPTRYHRYGHVILLTSDYNMVCAADMVHDQLQMHVFCPGSPSSRAWDSVTCNGWKMGLMVGDRTQAPGGYRNKDPNELSNRLRSWTSHARAGRSCGSMSDLKLTIECGPQCCIESVMGDLRYPSLLPGEVKSVLVQMAVQRESSSVPAYSITSASSSTDSRSEEDISTRLNKLLGIPDTTLLHAKVTYGHSSLPTDTVCSITRQCHLDVTSPREQHIPRKPVPDRASESQAIVQRSLATYYASYMAPRKAIDILQDKFGTADVGSTCHQYIQSLIKELTYQARLSERLAIENSPQKRRNASPSTQSIVSRETAPSMSLPDIYAHENASLHRPTRTHQARDESQLSLLEAPGLDDARKIWSHIRHLSRGTGDADRWNGSGTAEPERSQHWMRELALRNKRSIGASTIRSFTAPVDHSRLRMSTPFL